MDSISVYKQDQLDIPTKSFEVAFRSYVAQKILAAYPQKEALQAELQKQVSILNQSSAILTERIKSTIKEYLNGKKWESFWVWSVQLPVSVNLTRSLAGILSEACFILERICVTVSTSEISTLIS